MLKGVTEIELTDSKGNVERYKSENLVTNAVQDLLSYNVGGLANQYTIPLKNMFAGVVLFDTALEEVATNTIPPSGANITGFAGSTVNTTDNPLCGSPNITESEALEDGYKFVFDFTNTQANGQIGSVCLSNGDLSSAIDVRKPIADLFNLHKYSEIPVIDPDITKCTDVDFEGGYTYTHRVYKNTDGTMGVLLKKYKHRFLEFGLNDTTNGFTLVEEITKPLTLDWNISTDCKGIISYSSDANYFYAFKVFYSQDNGNGKIIMLKMSKLDYSVVEKTLVVDKALFSIVNLSEKHCKDSCPLLNGYLYVPAKNKTTDGFYSMYKININNPADTSLLPSVRTEAFNSIGYYTSIAIGGNIYSYSFSVFNGVVQAGKVSCLDGYSSHMYKNYIVKFEQDSSYTYRNKITLYKHNMYLATINNIAPVTKTPDKTMKITYTLREVSV